MCPYAYDTNNCRLKKFKFDEWVEIFLATTNTTKPIMRLVKVKVVNENTENSWWNGKTKEKC